MINSINFYDENFKSEFEHLDKDKPVYIYCRSGGRSAKSTKKLLEMGFEKIYDLDGGLLNYDKTTK